MLTPSFMPRTLPNTPNAIKSRLLKTSAITATVIGLASFNASANDAAKQYYSCTQPTGCTLVKNIKVQDDYAATKYPAVLAHGAIGWGRLFNVLDYFNGIPEVLGKSGMAVFSTKTSSINSDEVRGEQLLQQINTITAITGKDKVNIFGHSQGGVDARYVASVAPDKVASVTAISSPAQGSAFAEWLLAQVNASEPNPDSALPQVNITSEIFKLIGNVMDLGNGISIKDLQNQDAKASLGSLSYDSAMAFNKKHPAPVPTTYCGYPPADNVMNGIGYYSFMGNKVFTNPFDISDYVFALTSLTFKGDPNDGFVAVCSSRLGHVIRDDYPMNHLDSINQFFGMTAWGQPNPTSVYRQQANRLKKDGY